MGTGDQSLSHGKLGRFLRCPCHAQARDRERERGATDDARLAAARRAAEDREAELRKAMRDGEAKLRERISRLDEDNQDLRRCEHVWCMRKMSTMPSTAFSVTSAAKWDLALRGVQACLLGVNEVPSDH